MTGTQSATSQPTDSSAGRPAEKSSRLSTGVVPVIVVLIVVIAVRMRRRR